MTANGTAEDEGSGVHGAPLFQLEGVGFEIAGRTILDDLALTLEPGRVHGLIGPNGSGKSTLVRLLARQARPRRGSLAFCGRPIDAYRDREFARQLAYLPQTPPPTDGMTARELVALGRYPHHGPLGRLGKDDAAAIDEAMARTGTRERQGRNRIRCAPCGRWTDLCGRCRFGSAAGIHIYTATGAKPPALQRFWIVRDAWYSASIRRVASRLPSRPRPQREASAAPPAAGSSRNAMILSETAPLGTDSAAPHSFRHVRRRKTTQDLVYEQIRDALSAGTFEAGRSFTITSMADQFGTSHMPVREALRRLVAEHALELDSTGTARVPLTTPEGLDHLCDARCIVERAAAELAFPGFHAAAIDALDAVALTHVEALRQGDAARMLSSNREFHFMIYEASGNPVLINLIQNLWLRYGPYVRLLTDRMTEMLKQDAAGSYSKHHLELIAALRRGDGKGAGAAIVDDIQNSQRLLHRFFY